jgi:D-3-phosphoglycerate dehydrogenase
MALRVLVSCVQMQTTLPQHRERLEALGLELVVPEIKGQQLDEDELLELMPEIDGVIAGDDLFTAAVLEASPRLRIISKWGIGTDSIDKMAAEKLGITVTNTPGVFGDEVADMALGYVLLLGRRQHQVDAAVRAGGWPKMEGESFRDQVALVVGLGSIGLCIVTRLQAIGMKVIGHDPSLAAQQAAEGLGATTETLVGALPTADWVVLAAPLTNTTRRLLNRERLALLPDGARVVNVARGQLVDQEALIEALESGRLGGAALDVFEVEPLPADSPLTRMDNVVLGAHNGSNTRQAVERTSALAVENLLAHLGLASEPS